MGSKDTSIITRERINLLGIFLDIISPEELTEFIFRIFNPFSKDVAPGEGKNIVLLSLWDLLRARRNYEYRKYVLNATLVIPISKSLTSGARFLEGQVPNRYMPFHFFIHLLTILEMREDTVYLLGGNDKVLKKAENNIRQTFPRLRIVGRCGASFRKQDEKTIVEAIRKTAPKLLLVGRGVKGGEFWIARNHEKLNLGLRIWCSDLFDVFAKRRRRPPDMIFDMGLESIIYCFRNPLRFFRIFLYLRYKFLLLFSKFFG